MAELRGDKRQAARDKKRYGMRTQTRFWYAQANREAKQREELEKRHAKRTH